MSSTLIDNPKLFRHLVEDLPMGIYIVDPERRIRFWNHGTERITGHLAHEVLGRVLDDVVRACDRDGVTLPYLQRPVTMTIQEREPQGTAFYLHKDGHRVGVTVRTRPILEYGTTIGGASVLFEEASAHHEEKLMMYGCLDTITGIPSHRLTRAVMYECMAGMEESHLGFGLLQIRPIGLEDFRSKHGPQSVVPFLRAAAHTLRQSLESENFLGCWGDCEFLAVLSSGSPVTIAKTAETLRQLLSHSEVLWWGDRFLVNAEVTYAVAGPGDDLKSLLEKMKPAHSGAAAKAVEAGVANHSLSLRG